MNSKQLGFIDYTPVIVLAWIGLISIALGLIVGTVYLVRWVFSLFS